MRKKFLVIGDDARQENLARLYGTIAFKESDKDLKKQIKHSNIIILPIGTNNENITSNIIKYSKKGSIIFGGNLSTNFIEPLAKKGCKTFDILKNKKICVNLCPKAVLSVCYSRLS